MLIVMKPQASEADVRRVCEKIASMGFRAHPMPGAQRTAVGITGNPGPLEPEEFEILPGVAEAIRVSKPFKLVSREVKPEDSLIHIGPPNAGVTVGGKELALIAGPCAIENRPQARAAVAVGADGLIVEVHPDPDHAVSDGYQSLFPQQFEALVEQASAIAGVLGRTITPAASRK